MVTPGISIKHLNVTCCKPTCVCVCVCVWCVCVCVCVQSKIMRLKSVKVKVMRIKSYKLQA